jgi:hypothetical protein
MKTQFLRPGIGSAQLFGDMCPHAPCGPELGYLFKEIVMAVKEEGQPFGEYVNI